VELTDDREPDRSQPVAAPVTHRPAPIARFAGTLVMQFLLNLVVYDLLVLAPRAVTLGACALLALALAAYAYAGWLGQAARGWKIATFAALTLNALSVTFLGQVRLA
jgi:hypothetical protein